MPRVLGIGLDAASRPLLESLIAAGDLPVLAALAGRGRWGPLGQPAAYRAELAWTEFLCGERNPAGYWGTVGFDAADYGVVEVGAARHAPFYAGPDAPTTVAFDIPHSWLAPAVRGLQVTAWGAHSPQHPPAATPAGLLRDLVARFGGHPAARSDSQPGWHHNGYQAALVGALCTGAARRAEAMCWLLEHQPDWDLALTVFGEPHVVGHLLWHGIETDHPVAAVAPPGAFERVRQVYRAVDSALGRLVDAVGPDTVVVVFAVHDTVVNRSDVLSQFVLPELLAAAAGVARRLGDCAATGPLLPRAGRPVSSLLVTHRRRWAPARLGAARARLAGRQPLPWWQLDERPAEEVSVPFSPGAAGGSPATGQGRSDAFGYQVPVWYRPQWHRMAAFALPSFSDAHVRLNVAGREPAGRVPPQQYSAELDRIESLLRACRDRCTGETVFACFDRLRAADPFAPGGPPADLIAYGGNVVDAIWHPQLGTVGPFPYLRTGEHGTAGFALVSGAGGSGTLPALPTSPAALGRWLAAVARSGR